MFDNENKCLSTIKDIREQPDLGVQMDESLKFEKQIGNICCAESKWSIGMYQKNF